MKNEEQRSFHNPNQKSHQRTFSSKNNRRFHLYKYSGNLLKSLSENKPQIPSKSATKKYGKRDATQNKLEEITARFNHSPQDFSSEKQPYLTDNSQTRSQKTQNVQNLIDTLYKKINAVADSTKKFMSSAEKLSKYCEFSRLEAKIDLKNYQSEKSNIEKELNNLVSF